jgi:hypothetical protein
VKTVFLEEPYSIFQVKNVHHDLRGNSIQARQRSNIERARSLLHPSPPESLSFFPQNFGITWGRLKNWTWD